MKIKISQPALAANLSSLIKLIPSRNSHPSLSCFKIVSNKENGNIKVTAYDLEHALIILIPAEVEEKGDCLLPAKGLIDVISKLSIEKPVEISVNEDYHCLITSGKSEYTLQGMGIEDYPELPVLTEGISTIIPAPLLLGALKSVLFAASSDATKQVLTGVVFESLNGELTLTGCDGHRLAVNSFKMEGLPIFKVNVPGATLKELVRLLSNKMDTEVKLKANDRYIVFGLTNKVFISRLLDGIYPNTKQLIPEEFNITSMVGRKELLEILERISVMSNNANNVICTNFSKDELIINATVDDLGTGKECMDVSSTNDISIGFNHKYLSEGVKVIEAEVLSIKMNQPTSPVIMGSEEDPNFLYLVMPIHLRK